MNNNHFTLPKTEEWQSRFGEHNLQQTTKSPTLTEKIIGDYRKATEFLDNLTQEIWDYINDNYKNELEFGEDSDFINWCLLDSGLLFEYSHYKRDLWGMAFIEIPMHILNEEKWKVFIDEYFSSRKNPSCKEGS